MTQDDAPPPTYTTTPQAATARLRAPRQLPPARIHADSLAPAILRLHALGFRSRDIADALNTSQPNVCQCLRLRHLPATPKTSPTLRARIAALPPAAQAQLVALARTMPRLEAYLAVTTPPPEAQP